MATTIPTIPQVRAWSPQVLITQATEWEQKAQTLGDALDASARSVDSSRDYWIGTAGDSMRGRHDEIHGDATTVKKALEDGATAARNGAKRIQADKDYLFKFVDEAKGVHDTAARMTGGFDVADDGRVTVPASIVSSLMNTGSDSSFVVVTLASLQARAAQYQKDIQAALGGCGVADDDVMAAITKAFSGLPTTQAPAIPGDPDAGLTGDRGQRLGQQVKDAGGNIPSDLLSEAGYELQEAGLTPDQIADVKAGKTVEIPQATQQFLQQFTDAAGLDGLSQLQTQLKAQHTPTGDEQSRAVSDSIRMLSDENVVGTNADGTSKTPGGMQLLPTQMQQLASSRVNALGVEDPDGNTTQFPGYEGYPPTVARTKWLGEMNKFSSLVGGGDSDYRAGTKFSTELDRQAAHIAYMQNHGAGLDKSGALGTDHMVNDLVSTANTNKDATTALLTGHDATGVLGGADWDKHYNRDSTMIPLLEYQFQDKTSGSAVDGMMNWIGVDSALPGADGDRAGHAAYGLSQLLSSSGTNAELMNTLGQQNAALGKINPHLTQTIATALSPYIGDMAMGPNDQTGTHGFGSLDDKSVSRLFSLIDTDGEAGKTFNANAYGTVAELENRFANSAVTDPHHTRYDLADAAGRVQAYIEQGYQQAADHQSLDNKTVKDAENAAYDRAKTLVSGGAKFLPGNSSKIVGSAIDLFSNNFKDSLIGSPDVAKPPSVSNDQSMAVQYYNIAQALHDNGQLNITPDIAPYIKDGHMLSYDDATKVKMDNQTSPDPRAGASQLSSVFENYFRDNNFPISEFLTHLRAGHDGVTKP